MRADVKLPTSDVLEKYKITLDEYTLLLRILQRSSHSVAVGCAHNDSTRVAR